MTIECRYAPSKRRAPRSNILGCAVDWTMGRHRLHLIFLPLRAATQNPYLHFAADFLLEVGKAALITGVIAWVLEIAHVASYFEDRLFRVFMNPRFLEKLDRQKTLPEIHRAITTHLFGGTDDPEARDYYRYLTRHHMRLAGETYRKNLNLTIEIESLPERPNVRATTFVTYAIVPASLSGPAKYRNPSPQRHDPIHGLEIEKHVEEWTSQVLYPHGRVLKNEEYRTSGGSRRRSPLGGDLLVAGRSTRRGLRRFGSWPLGRDIPDFSLGRRRDVPGAVKPEGHNL